MTSAASKNGSTVPTRVRARARERARELPGPRLVAARKRGVIRLDLTVLTTPAVHALSDSHYRALTTFWAWIARYGKQGEIRADWLGAFRWKSRRRLTTRMLDRFLELGLIEQHVYDDDGTVVIQVPNWKDYSPVDSTSAERKRRYRRKVYGDRFYGIESDLAEIAPESEDAA